MLENLEIYIYRNKKFKERKKLTLYIKQNNYIDDNLIVGNIGNIEVNENDIYIIEIENYDERNIKDISLYIGDFKCEVKKMKDKQCMKFEGKLFGQCFGLSRIWIYITLNNNTIKKFFTDYLKVKSNKFKGENSIERTNKYISTMLKEVENGYEKEILEVDNSKDKYEVGIKNNGKSGIKGTFILLENILNVLINTYPYFRKKSNRRIISNEKIVKANNVKCIDDNNINWIIQHPENMQEINRISPISFNDKYYKIEKININKIREDNNTYENQVLLWFINNIIEYLRKKLKNLNLNSNEFSSNYDYNMCFKDNQKERRKKINRYLREYKKIFNLYKNCLGCNLKEIKLPIKNTDTFRKKVRYRKCFEVIKKWLEEDKYDFEKDDFYIKLEMISKIFEYYTLLKIREAIKLKGGSLLEGEKTNIVFKSPGKDTDKKYSKVRNYYIYKYENLKIEIFYEPYIYKEKRLYDIYKSDIDLFSIGCKIPNILNEKYKFKNSNPGGKMFEPDFVIKISKEDNKKNKAAYFIIDSKFSSLYSTRCHHMQELINKYILGIKSEKSDVIGMWAIYPNDYNDRLAFKEFSDKEYFPILGIEPLQTNKNSMNSLLEEMINASIKYLDIEIKL